ncbi:DUF4144 family protein [Photobacterium halotolerans]|uniref:Uncharacterized protein n=1 Tax=Photobacterium halotolerans TaxID=265726 RepID=A0A0F5VE90_9GAMM|nr:DUF4144 family protein [Photobacterium halotolerans]KKC99804.1 hypothetical protein KY46_11365 [Photobacterium halotolerans]
MVVWPAVLKYEGDQELSVVADRQTWESDADLHCFGFQPDDVLIDSTGQVFRPLSLRPGETRLEASEKTMRLEDIVELIKAHQSCLGACCAAKVAFDSVAEAIDALSMNTL